ncbi:Outer membrane protein assembly factor BamA [BD1-7 clade bacterium]|uniref:Outer membrane protein assembly factor BamA n=1 Tax=BD1-7 clade bacterium TaxID=2029982 RepID=A0A5S9PWV2_9GAMM|nr:Outer membrane protein assembly factor BamA [BD1-7 clade bacterium]
MFKRFFAVVLLLVYSSLVFAKDGFTISDIRIEGLQRIPAGSVFASLPFNINDEASPELINEAINVLFRSGNFNDVEMGRDGDVLVVRLSERPSIASIDIEGNKAIKSEDLLEGLNRSGLSEGRVFKRATLEGIRLELQRQYVAQGRYDATIVAEIEQLPRNRVAVHIDVNEGTVAKVKHMNIVGAEAYRTSDLLELLEIHPSGLLSLIKGDDKYSRERLRGDLERLESFYRDRGYLKFNIDSTQVALSPERDAVFITINVSEGDIYTISDVKLSGEIILPEPVVRSLILVGPKSVYSQGLVTQTEELVAKVLGNDGYTFAKVRSYPKVDEDEKTVELTFFVDPGNRTYVNRIEFTGNTTTQDEVLRREMRQMEAAPASGNKVEQSRLRLERLGFFKSVESEIVEVPGQEDLVDVKYNVEEQHSGSIGASIGYADGSGLVLSANLQQNNFLGTGNRVGVSVTKNDYQFATNISYTDPYYTIDGVSAGFSVFYRKTDFERLGVSEYSTNTFGGALNFGYPISEISRLGFGIGYANIDVTTGVFAPQEIVGSPEPFAPNFDEYIQRQFRDGIPVFPPPVDEQLRNIDVLYDQGINPFVNAERGFIDDHGSRYNSFTLNASWRQSKLNRGLLPTAGYSQSISAEVGIPGTDLEYYKLIYDGQIYVPVLPEVSFRFHAKIGYGGGFGNTNELPFFENFFAGGFGSVRGFERATLGPRGTPAQVYQTSTPFDTAGQPSEPGQLGYVYDPDLEKFVTQERASSTNSFGGNVLVEGGAEFIFPVWFIKDRRSLRTVLFLDAGNVFDSNCGSGQLNCNDIDVTQLRASVGLGLTWISALGPLTFSLAKPFNDTRFDDTKIFQFSIGTGF